MATIAIDYDDTFTLDPVAWFSVVCVLQAHGHRVVCVTARRNVIERRQEVEQAMPAGVDVFCVFDQPKRSAMRERGISVDVWIDDRPEVIPDPAEVEGVCVESAQRRAAAVVNAEYQTKFDRARRRY